MKPKWKGEIVKAIIIAGDFNTLLSVIDRISRQKIRKDIESLDHPINHINLIHIYRTLHQTTAKYLFFSMALRIFTKIELMMDHKERSQ